MRALLQYLLKHGNTLLFLLLEALAFLLLFLGNDFHQSVAFTSAGRLKGGLYRTTERITGYFHLREQNDVLWRENSRLEQQVARLEAVLEQTQLQQQPLWPSLEGEYLHGRVVRNSIHSLNNTFTIDIGTAEGVVPGMGVCSPEGVAGLVAACSEHFSVVLSVLNTRARYSCRIKGTDVVGSLTWNGRDIHRVRLGELPGFRMWNDGDTVVTSGFSESFPEGIPVGVVEKSDKRDGDNFYTAQVRLFTRFESLAQVRMFRGDWLEEQRTLEKEVQP